MKIARAVCFALLVLLLGTSSTAYAVHERSRVSVNVSVFFDALAPYGSWHSSPRYGRVWEPSYVSAGWRPYSDGYWVYTEFGWTWVSDDPWGWATYHYGRWTFDPVWGWIWVPGTEWAPAWVSFHHGGGWIGWAPLPPGAGFSAGFSFASHPRSYCFVEERHFLDRDVRRRIASFDRNPMLLRRTANVTRFATVNRTVVNRSLAVERVARATRRPVPTHRVVDVGSARQARAARGREVPMFRPRVTSARPSHPPRAVSRRPRGSQAEGRAALRRPPERRRPPSVAARASGPQRELRERAARAAPQRRVARAPQRPRDRQEVRRAQRPPRERQAVRQPQGRQRERPAMSRARPGRQPAVRRQAPQRRPPQQMRGRAQAQQHRPQMRRPQQQPRRPQPSMSRGQAQRQPAMRRHEGRSGGRQARPQRQQRRDRQRGRPPGL